MRLSKVADAPRPVWLLQATARAPRLLLSAAVAILVLLGARALVAPAAQQHVQRPSAHAMQLPAQALAEAFARAYLSWDADQPDQHAAALRQFAVADRGLEDEVVPRHGSQRVLWTAVERDAPAGERRRVVTVAALTDAGVMRLAVTVSRDDRRRLYIDGPPAIVGPPIQSPRPLPHLEPEVTERAVRQVVERVVRNYLARDRADLLADLDATAAVSLPDRPLHVREIESLTWARHPRKVAAVLVADDPVGARLTLRYELSLVRRGGRWLVRTVQTNPLASEGN